MRRAMDVFCQKGRADGKPLDGRVVAALLGEDLVDVGADGRVLLHHSVLDLALHRALQHVLLHHKLRTESVHQGVCVTGRSTGMSVQCVVSSRLFQHRCRHPCCCSPVSACKKKRKKPFRKKKHNQSVRKELFLLCFSFKKAAIKTQESNLEAV